MKVRRILDYPLGIARRAKRSYRVRDTHHVGVAVRGDGRKNRRNHSAPVNKVHRLIEGRHSVVLRGSPHTSYAKLCVYPPFYAFLSRMAWR